MDYRARVRPVSEKKERKRRGKRKEVGERTRKRKERRGKSDLGVDSF